MIGNPLVFVSYSSKDRNVANAVVAGLEGRGVRCWVAPRDIDPGAEWAEAIMDGIKRATAMVVVFSGSANESRQVLREVERAINHGLTVIPFRIEDIQPSGAMEYFLTVPHWLDAMTEPMEASIARLYDALPGVDATPLPPDPSVLEAVGVEANRRRNRALTVVIVVALGLAALAGVWTSGVLTSSPDTAAEQAQHDDEPARVPMGVDRLSALLVEQPANVGQQALANVTAVLALREQIPNQAIALKLWLDPDRERYSGGDRFTIKMSVDRDSYVAVFVHSSDGSTVLLYPNRFDDGTKVVADTVFAVGDGSTAFELEVMPPWGIDVIHAVASSDRAAMVKLIESAVPVDGTPFQVIDRTTLTRGIGAVAAAPAAGGATASDVGAWGDALHAVITQP
ncbi:MAG: TIR domain-containing protein [Pseudomonadota bacterium]